MDLGLRGSRSSSAGAAAGWGARSPRCSSRRARASSSSRVTPTRSPERPASSARRRRPAAADLAEPGAAETIAAALDGPLHGVLLNHGGPPFGRALELSDDEWQRAFDLVLRGPIRLLRALVPRLADGASIVWITSSTVREPMPGLDTSNVLRPGVASLVKTLSRDLAPGVRVNGLAPGRDRHRPHGRAREGPRRVGGDLAGRPARARGRPDPARPPRGARRARASRGVPALAGRVLRDGAEPRRRRRPRHRRALIRPRARRARHAAVTRSPSATLTLRTVASKGETSGVSIFIASRTTSGCRCSTRSPSRPARESPCPAWAPRSCAPRGRFRARARPSRSAGALVGGDRRAGLGVQPPVAGPGALDTRIAGERRVLRQERRRRPARADLRVARRASGGRGGWS